MLQSCSASRVSLSLVCRYIAFLHTFLVIPSEARNPLLMNNEECITSLLITHYSLLIMLDSFTPLRSVQNDRVFNRLATLKISSKKQRKSA